MRTTFTPNPRVDRAIRERTEREGKSLSQVVNELIEAALEPESPPAAPYRVRAKPLGLRPGFDPEKLGEVLHGLDVEER